MHGAMHMAGGSQNAVERMTWALLPATFDLGCTAEVVCIRSDA